jgi:ribulose-5-phosphate 4-epimerase/fuculose-1-phosphate aldolase
VTTTIAKPQTPAGAAGYSSTEWALRVELAACYHLFDYLGWTEMIFNHITMRVPGPEHHFLINPFGLHYSEVTPQNLVKIDLDGKIVGHSDYPVNPAGFVIHSAIHAAVPDARCIMHTHTTAGLAVASSKRGLVPTNFYSATLVGQVAYHDFEGPSVHDDEKPRLVANLGDKSAMILRNHGLLVAGPTIPDAFELLFRLDRACEIQVATEQIDEGILLSDEVCATAADRILNNRRPTPDGLTATPTARIFFDAMARQAEKKRLAAGLPPNGG